VLKRNKVQNLSLSGHAGQEKLKSRQLRGELHKCSAHITTDKMKLTNKQELEEFQMPHELQLAE
jgi:hypothetical protein